MRVPPSVIVMGVLTAVPFALAIRAATKDSGKHHAHDDYDEDVRLDLDDLNDSESARRAAVEAEMQEQRQKLENDTKRDRIEQRVVGEEPPSLGALFEGFALGPPAAAIQP